MMKVSFTIFYTTKNMAFELVLGWAQGRKIVIGTEKDGYNGSDQ
jgi:hypothetical protein